MALADFFAGKGSFAARSKARREAVESGEIEQARPAFIKGEWRDLSVDGVTGNRKETSSDVDEKKELRGEHYGDSGGGR